MIKLKDRNFCLILVFLLVISGIIIPLSMIVNSGKQVIFNTLYADDCIFGLNTPAQVPIVIYLDGTYLETVNTDEFGIGTLYMMEGGEYTYSVLWQGTYSPEVDLDESLLSQTVDLEVATWYMDTDAYFYWAHDLTPIVSSVIDLTFDGVVVGSILTTAVGRLDSRLYGLTVGDWQFVGATEVLTIVSTEDGIIGGEVFYVMPKEDSISELIIKGEGLLNRQLTH